MKHLYIITPSAPTKTVPREDITKAFSFLENTGRRVSLPASIFEQDLSSVQILRADTDARRLKDLQEALESDADEIMALIGGYGLTRLIPDLMSLKKPDKQKVMYGFSDTTALHIFLNQHWDWPTVHGPSGIWFTRENRDPISIERTLRVMNEGLSAFELPPLSPLNSTAKRLSQISGKIVGGNLCLVQTSLGTAWQLQTKEKILFLEEVNEEGYQVDRMLNHLGQAGLFEDVKAILLGDFIRVNEPEGTEFVWDVLQKFADKASFPVFRLPGCGHGPQNHPIPFNYEISLKVST